MLANACRQDAQRIRSNALLLLLVPRADSELQPQIEAMLMFLRQCPDSVSSILNLSLSCSLLPLLTRQIPQV